MSSQRTKSKKKNQNHWGLILFLLQLVLTVVFVVFLALLDVLPTKLLAIVVLLLLVLLLLSFCCQRYKQARTAGKVFTLLMILILLVGSIYMGKTWSALQQITDPNTDSQSSTHTLSVIVLQEDPAETLEDIREYRFGIQEKVDRTHTDQAVEKIEEELSTKLNAVEFESYRAQIDALYESQVGAILVNEAYRAAIEELDSSFADKTRVLTSIVLKDNSSDTQQSSERVNDITEEPFVIFLSGIDTFGQISTTSRSDVNILAAVNPKTKQILLLTTPRDYYVELASYGELDKLTHAGLYGVEESMATLGKLYGIDIDYYLRVNFTGFENVIDALGGVEVYSEYEFTSTKGVYFQQGYNQLDGEKALAFVRERYAFPTGDIQRGRNQMALITAVIDKALSPTLLTNYVSIMDSVSESFTTNVPSSKITALVKMQLEDNASWNIVRYNVSGSGSTEATYSFGSEPLWVMIPDMDTVAYAQELLRQVRDGEILSKELD
jgi:LCP family protein required for cell wall assembly